MTIISDESFAAKFIAFFGRIVGMIPVKILSSIFLMFTISLHLKEVTMKSSYTSPRLTDCFIISATS